MVSIKYYNDTRYQTYEIGDTGVLHMLRDTNVQDMCFIGKRMHIVDPSRQPFLENWECVLDSSAGDGTSVISYWLDDHYNSTGNPVKLQQDDDKAVTLLKMRWEGLFSNINDIVKDIPNPQYNTLYFINGNYYIYYVNGNWYPVEFSPEVESTVLAAVPIEGIVSYYGNVIRNSYH